MTLTEEATIASVSAQLEQSPHYLRIKKLLIFACTGTWETEPERLAAVDLRDLLVKTLEVRPTMRELRPTLENLVRNLNKPVEYMAVAETILRAMAALYPDEDPTEWLRTQTPPDQAAILPPQEWFDLRLELFNRTNPLRLKILVARVLRQGDMLLTAPWLMVKGLELERLLRDLLLAFPDYDELCQRLETTAEQLEEPEEYQQVAGTLREVLQPVYQRLQKRPTIADVQPSPPVESPPEPVVVIGPEPEMSPEPVIAPVVTEPDAPAVERVSDLLRQELSTEVVLRQRVSTAVEQVMAHIEQVFRQLEGDLEAVARDLPPSLRYRYLREFVGQVQAVANRLTQILDRLDQGGA
ncbi:MAG: hypothetical protein RMI89_02225 [Gloeomargarita sp. SKYBB_i_bin120]|nr:hypothetical protein [Gloeomargarita sp. SKYG98]MCS7291779.1 hypothetical protein [Gloeomargarita sp. SKYB120]MDW8177339.1 hypothetical protein [Gloeomargarita sp. SKYBB_i_bin120]